MESYKLKTTTVKNSVTTSYGTIYYDGMDVELTNGDIHLSGTLSKKNDGTGFNLEFEIDWFLNDESEKYWDDNWESIESVIIEKFR